MDAYFVEWKFSPENFFEDEFSETIEGVCLDFQSGIIQGSLGLIDYEQADAVLQKLHPHVQRLFQVVQMQSHSLYDLPYGMIFQKRPDGTRKIPISVSIGPAQFSIKSNISVDRDGQTIWCAREEKSKLRKKVATYSKDLILQRLLRSYSAAVSYPEDELIHLYEIRDALATRFKDEKGKSRAIQELTVGKSEKERSYIKKGWQRLGELANSLPVSQGRHRGEILVNQLRSATEEELNDARKIARTLIEFYLAYLDKHPGLTLLGYKIVWHKMPPVPPA
jgi:hypothetical protein